MSIELDIQKLSPGSIIELYELDLTLLGGTIARFHSGVNGMLEDVVWQGNPYSAFPVKGTGFEISGTSKSPRPKMTVSNVTGFMSQLNKAYDDMVGAKVTRRRTLVKYLDAINFPGGVNVDADPTAEFPSDIYYIERKSYQDKTSVEYELSGLYDLDGIKIPFRQVIAATCTWTYRGPDCRFTGGAIADRGDVSTTDIGLDECGKRLASCKLRYPEPSALPFGGFPSAGKIG